METLWTPATTLLREKELETFLITNIIFVIANILAL